MRLDLCLRIYRINEDQRTRREKVVAARTKRVMRVQAGSNYSSSNHDAKDGRKAHLTVPCVSSDREFLPSTANKDREVSIVDCPIIGKRGCGGGLLMNTC